MCKIRISNDSEFEIRAPKKNSNKITEWRYYRNANISYQESKKKNDLKKKKKQAQECRRNKNDEELENKRYSDIIITEESYIIIRELIIRI